MTVKISDMSIIVSLGDELVHFPSREDLETILDEADQEQLETIAAGEENPDAAADAFAELYADWMEKNGGWNELIPEYIEVGDGVALVVDSVEVDASDIYSQDSLQAAIELAQELLAGAEQDEEDDSDGDHD